MTLEQLAEVSPFLAGCDGRASDVAAMVGHQPDEVLALEGIQETAFLRLVGTWCAG
jgi:hypothetical protein